jgi:hypothetical protein
MKFERNLSHYTARKFTIYVAVSMSFSRSSKWVRHQNFILDSPIRNLFWLGFLSQWREASSGCGWRDDLQMGAEAGNVRNSQPQRADKNLRRKNGLSYEKRHNPYTTRHFQSAMESRNCKCAPLPLLLCQRLSVQNVQKPDALRYSRFQTRSSAHARAVCYTSITTSSSVKLDFVHVVFT